MKIRRVDFSPDEWLAGTRDLTAEERGLYWDCCALMYSRGGPIADDERWLGKALAVDVRMWRRIRCRLLILGKLREVSVDGRPHLINDRSEREIAKATGRISQARDAAEESARRRRQEGTSAEDRPNFSPTSPGSSAEVREKFGRSEDENQPDSLKINGLDKADASGSGEANHQPPTINQEEEILDTDRVESLTAPSGDGAGERGEPSAGSDAGSRTARPATRGTRLPDGWQPGPELEQFARDLDLDPKSVTDEFVDFWRGVAGQKGVKLDWDATFRNRCRQLAERRNPNGSRTRRPQDVSSQEQRRHSNASRQAAFVAGLGGNGGRGSSGGGS